MAIASVASGRHFLKYCEERKWKDVKTDVTAIRNAEPLLCALQQVQSNLSFPRSVICKAIDGLVKSKAEDVSWSMQPKYQKEYTAVMSNRVFNLCRCVQQAIVKKSKWTLELPWMQEKQAGQTKRRRPRYSEPEI